MVFNWHCAGCNEKGESFATLLDLIKLRKNKEDLFELLSLFVLRTHSCEKPVIGVKISSGEQK